MQPIAPDSAPFRRPGEQITVHGRLLHLHPCIISSMWTIPSWIRTSYTPEARRLTFESSLVMIEPYGKEIILQRRCCSAVSNCVWSVRCWSVVARASVPAVAIYSQQWLLWWAVLGRFAGVFPWIGLSIRTSQVRQLLYHLGQKLRMATTEIELPTKHSPLQYCCQHQVELDNLNSAVRRLQRMWRGWRHRAVMVAPRKKGKGKGFGLRSLRSHYSKAFSYCFLKFESQLHLGIQKYKFWIQRSDG